MFCPACGSENPEGSRFCSTCAMEIPAATQVPDPTRVMPPPQMHIPYQTQQPFQQPPPPSFQQQPIQPPVFQPSPPPPPYYQQQGFYPPNSYKASGRATAAMVLAIVSIVPGLCFSFFGMLLGITAAVVGKQEMDAIRRGLSSPAGLGNAKFGLYCGIVGAILNFIFMISYCGLSLIGR